MSGRASDGLEAAAVEGGGGCEGGVDQGGLGSQRGQQFGTGTQWGVPHCISTYWHPLRWTGNASGVPSPCLQSCENQRRTAPFGTGVDTHTHTLVESTVVSAGPKTQRIKRTTMKVNWTVSILGQALFVQPECLCNQT